VDPGEKVGFVLSGGGARAAFEVGVLKTIYGNGCPAARKQNPPEVFCGSGAGAFNAAVLTSRLPGQSPSPIGYLESLWADEIPREGLSRNNRVYRKRLDSRQFFDLPYMWRRPFKSWVQYCRDLGFLAPELARRTWKALTKMQFGSWLDLTIWHDTSPMLRLISESISLEIIRDGESDQPQRALRVVATERGTGKPTIFRNEHFTDEIGHEAILASCALPIIFPSVEIHGKEYFYGGLVMQTPLQPAVDAGCTVVHLIHNEPKAQQRDRNEESSAREMLNRTIAVALSATLERDLDSRRRTNATLAAFERARGETGVDIAQFLDQASGYRRVAVHQYRPKQLLGGKTGFLDFSRATVEAAIAAGEREAARHDCIESECIL
jgi:NTE family protein